MKKTLTPELIAKNKLKSLLSQLYFDQLDGHRLINHTFLQSITNEARSNSAKNKALESIARIFCGERDVTAICINDDGSLVVSNNTGNGKNIQEYWGLLKQSKNSAQYKQNFTREVYYDMALKLRGKQVNIMHTINNLSTLTWEFEDESDYNILKNLADALSDFAKLLSKPLIQDKQKLTQSIGKIIGFAEELIRPGNVEKFRKAAEDAGVLGFVRMIDMISRIYRVKQDIERAIKFVSEENIPPGLNFVKGGAHAEMNVLEWIFKNKDKGTYYIATSKKPCASCYLTMEAFNEIYWDPKNPGGSVKILNSGTHAKFYIPWDVPPYFLSKHDGLASLKHLVERCEEIHKIKEQYDCGSDETDVSPPLPLSDEESGEGVMEGKSDSDNEDQGSKFGSDFSLRIESLKDDKSRGHKSPAKAGQEVVPPAAVFAQPRSPIAYEEEEAEVQEEENDEDDLSPTLGDAPSSSSSSSDSSSVSSSPVLGGGDEEDREIGWVSSYFGKYNIDGLARILRLRLDDLQLQGVEIIQGVFISLSENSLTSVAHQAAELMGKTVLVPLSLFNKHAAGLVIEKLENGQIAEIIYSDPQNKPIPRDLEQLILNNFSSQCTLKQITFEQQKYSNCGPEAIENFILYLTGQRLGQEQAIAFHSRLVEEQLLGKSLTTRTLLFDQSQDSELFSYSHQALSAQSCLSKIDFCEPELLGSF